MQTKTPKERYLKSPLGIDTSRRYESKSRTKNYRKKYKLLYRYNLTFEECEKITRFQKNLCALCHRKPQKRGLVGDHNHKTHIFRGFLCDRCNLTLALVENIKWLKKATRYLIKTNHPATKALGYEKKVPKRTKKC